MAGAQSALLFIGRLKAIDRIEDCAGTIARRLVAGFLERTRQSQQPALAARERGEGARLERQARLGRGPSRDALFE